MSFNLSLEVGCHWRGTWPWQRQLPLAKAPPEAGWPLRVVCMNRTPSSWGTKPLKPKGDSGWHIEASTMAGNEKRRITQFSRQVEGVANAASGPHTSSNNCGCRKGYFKNRTVHPGQCGCGLSAALWSKRSLVWFQSGHMPGLQTRSMFLTLSPSLPLSNK